MLLAHARTLAKPRPHLELPTAVQNSPGAVSGERVKVKSLVGLTESILKHGGVRRANAHRGPAIRRGCCQCTRFEEDSASGV